MEDEEALFIDEEDEYWEETYSDFRYMALGWGLSERNSIIMAIRIAIVTAGYCTNDDFFTDNYDPSN